MTSRAQEVARWVRVALESDSGLRPVVDVLYEELGDIQHPVVVRAGPDVWLVCQPGYGPASDPREFVQLAHDSERTGWRSRSSAWGCLSSPHIMAALTDFAPPGAVA